MGGGAGLVKIVSSVEVDVFVHGGWGWGSLRLCGGINNLLQVLRRVAHGFTNYDNYAARGILVTLILVGCARRGRV